MKYVHLKDRTELSNVYPAVAAAAAAVPALESFPNLCHAIKTFVCASLRYRQLGWCGGPMVGGVCGWGGGMGGLGYK